MTKIYVNVFLSGTLCEQDIDECASEPCVNGACQDRINAYYCLCDPGYEGPNCAQEIDECEVHRPCKNGATCTDRVASYVCECIQEENGVSYGGTNCTVPLIGCDSHLCQNDAKCVPYLVSEMEGSHNFTCECAAGFTGSYCGISTTATFNGSSWLKHTSDVRLGVLSIDFSFRTTLPNGTLFHMSDSSGSNRVYLVLAAPQLLTLYVKFSDSQTFTLSVYSARDLNDAEWHRVMVTAQLSQIWLSLTPPDCSLSTCNSSQDITSNMDSLFTTLLLGGLEVPAQEPALSSQAGPFVGCLQDVVVSGSVLLPAMYIGDPVRSAAVTLGCPRSEPCVPNPCRNGGACIDLWDKYDCQCVRPYIGETCDVGKYSEVFKGAGFSLHRENRENGERKILVMENKGNLEILPKHRDFLCAQVVNSLIVKRQDIGRFAAQFLFFQKSVSLSEIGTGNISSWTGKIQGICK